jgi:hypothetical protein
MNPLEQALNKKAGKAGDKKVDPREKLYKKDPKSKGALGVTDKGVYRHNPKTGFNELVHKSTGAFRGKSPY